jgi:hypothetical protein
MKHTMTKYTKLALTAAGVAASVACANRAMAQSDDALLNKLVQKGILTEAEAKDLSKENDKAFSRNLSSNLGLPGWVSSFKLNGDFRGRLDYLGSDNSAFTDRYRLRYRVRAGITAKLQDDFEVGLTLGSGDSGGNALSNNTTLENNGTKKPIWVDKAYAKWTPIHDGEWTLGTTIGKMGNPFQLSAMVFDPDYTPEGGALQVGYKINDQHALQFNTAGFVVDELGASSHDPYLLGAQALWNARWSSKVDSSVGIAAFGLGNRAGNDAALANGNTGNTQNNFNPYVLSGSVTYKLDHFPLFPGECPIKLAGEYMDNPAVSSNGEGYSIGATLGKAAKRGTWDLSYRYQRLEADAWYEGFVDDDNVAYNGGMVHGTNIKGHLVKLNYALTDALTFTFTGYFNDLINAGPANNGGTHIMADLMWKF